MECDVFLLLILRRETFWPIHNKGEKTKALKGEGESEQDEFENVRRAYTPRPHDKKSSKTKKKKEEERVKNEERDGEVRPEGQ